MKKYLVISILLSIPFIAINAQDKKVVAATSANTPSSNQQKIMDKLVELALKNPSVKVRDYERDKTVAELNKAGASWLNYVTLSANINEVTTGKFKGTNDPRNQLYYPLWNIGVAVPLGSLFTKPNDVRIARRNLDIATAERESAQRQIKAMVLSKYHNFVMTKELLTVQNELVEDDFASYSQAEAKLAAGTIQYEEYGNTARKYNDDRTKKMSLERDLNVIKLEIEEIIGVDLNDVMAQ
jgi:outer membrane protein TolC